MSKVCSGAFRSDVCCWTTGIGSLFGSALACPPIKVAAAIPTGMRNLNDFMHISTTGIPLNQAVFLSNFETMTSRRVFSKSNLQLLQLVLNQLTSLRQWHRGALG